jgi:diaminohydroxyphosphoribosylaminopyrimidine deaminase/5-amino-6-(5-phosphoribosylamino)uracil reductase
VSADGGRTDAGLRDGDRSPGAGVVRAGDEGHMDAALRAGGAARRVAAPNPWVGAVVVTTDGRAFTGATEAPGGRHAEVVALDRARDAGAPTAGSTLFVTLEPCAHHGRTPPCTEAVVRAGVRRVVVAVEDPDVQVRGRGLAALRAAGVEVDVGVGRDAAEEQLAAYLAHRRTGRPMVTLKLAATLDGRTAAPDGSSRWITGDAARADAHRLRAEHDAVLVGAGTVRRDDPELTVRHVPGPDPLRVVLGRAPAAARVHPALELEGPLADVLGELGSRGVVGLLVEGGATVAHAFHHAGLVDRYVLYLAPAFMGGADGAPLFAGPGAPRIDGLARSRVLAVRQLGDDLRIDLARAVAAAPVG